MNKRQKAKHFKMLYESLIAKGGPPFKVIHTTVPVQTYRIVKVMDENMPPDMRTIELRREMCREFEKIFFDNVNIEKVDDSFDCTYCDIYAKIEVKNE